MHVSVLMGNFYLVGWRFHSLYIDQFASHAAHTVYTALYFLLPACAVVRVRFCRCRISLPIMLQGGKPSPKPP